MFARFQGGQFMAKRFDDLFDIEFDTTLPVIVQPTNNGSGSYRTLNSSRTTKLDSSDPNLTELHKRRVQIKTN